MSKCYKYNLGKYGLVYGMMAINEIITDCLIYKLSFIKSCKLTGLSIYFQRNKPFSRFILLNF